MPDCSDRSTVATVPLAGKNDGQLQLHALPNEEEEEEGGEEEEEEEEAGGGGEEGEE